MRVHFKFKKIILVLIVVNVAYIFISQQISMNRIKQEIIDNKKEMQKLNEKNQELKDTKEMTKTDKYIENLARERSKLIKQGEIPIIEGKSQK